MNDYAILDTDGIVMMIVRWDGDIQTWAPPDGAERWADVSDPDLFVEVGGRLDAETLEFERHAEPDRYKPDTTVTPPPSGAEPDIGALLAKLEEKGILTAADVQAIAPMPAEVLEGLTADKGN